MFAGMAFRVFILWNKEAEDAAAKLREFLEVAFLGVEVFLSHASIELGTSWHPAVQDGLRSADFGVACFTSTTSEYAHYEFGFLHGRGVRVAILQIGEPRLGAVFRLHQVGRWELNGWLAVAQEINKALPAELVRDRDLITKVVKLWWDQGGGAERSGTEANAVTDAATGDYQRPNELLSEIALAGGVGQVPEEAFDAYRLLRKDRAAGLARLVDVLRKTDPAPGPP